MKPLKYQSASDPLNQNLAKITWADGLSFSPPSGEVNGLLAVRDTVIPGQLNALNQMASTLITNVNGLHTGGFDLNGNPGLDFFSGSDALSIRVNSAVTAKNIAVAGVAGQAGNSTVASNIAALQTSKLMNGGTDTILTRFITE